MYHLEELNQLEEAVSASPNNVYIRFILIQKLVHYQQYASHLKEHLTQLLSYDPKHTEAKRLLLKVYYDQGKYSAAIILGEELESYQMLNGADLIILAKCYLKEDNLSRAGDIYRSVLSENPEMMDDELDAVFRKKEAGTAQNEPEDKSQFMQKPEINFSDVGGMQEVKKEIELKIIKPLEHAELYKQYGKKIGGGILLYGPPGCGKTYLARATAGQIDAKFINVGLSDILDMWIGGSEKNLSALFDLARANTPCVLFIDEIDALGAKRSDLRQSAGKNVINQFLSELDGVDKNNDGVLIIGATNCPWHLDSAFRRPGRFDRIIFVSPPDVFGREEILKIMLAEKPIADINYSKVAKQLKEFSGADIQAVIDIAIEGKLVRAMETGVPEPIATQDLLEAAKKHRASTVDWFQTAKNYAMFANQSGLYDGILNYMKEKK